jgi:superfamily I DNA/RNA helicase
MMLVDRQEARDLEELERFLRSWHEREVAKSMKIANDDVAQGRLDLIGDQLAVCLAIAEDVDSLEGFRLKLETLFRDDGGAAIMCSTVHRAKGLESENVFLLEGTFRGMEDSEKDSEEQNIVYVAVTRSKQRLWFVSGFERKSKKEAEA